MRNVFLRVLLIALALAFVTACGDSSDSSDNSGSNNSSRSSSDDSNDDSNDGDNDGSSDGDNDGDSDGDNDGDSTEPFALWFTPREVIEGEDTVMEITAPAGYSLSIFSIIGSKNCSIQGLPKGNPVTFMAWGSNMIEGDNCILTLTYEKGSDTVEETIVIPVVAAPKYE